MANRTTVAEWIAGYERAWRTVGTGALVELFAEGASYRMSPYEDAVVGLAAIGELWERERVGPDEGFAMSHEIVAVDGDTAVVRLEVTYDAGAEYRDLWLIRFAPDGRCREFEEWPYWPGQPLSAEEAQPGGDR